MNRPDFTDDDLKQFAQLFKALGDETRQKILLLLTRRPMSVNGIVEHFTLAQPTISRHLAVLRHAHLVSSERSRQHIIYRISPAVLRRVCDEFLSVLTAGES